MNRQRLESIVYLENHYPLVPFKITPTLCALLFISLYYTNLSYQKLSEAVSIERTRIFNLRYHKIRKKVKITSLLVVLSYSANHRWTRSWIHTAMVGMIIDSNAHNYQIGKAIPLMCGLGTAKTKIRSHSWYSSHDKFHLSLKFKKIAKRNRSRISSSHRGHIPQNNVTNPILSQSYKQKNFPPICFV